VREDSEVEVKQEVESVVSTEIFQPEKRKVGRPRKNFKVRKPKKHKYDIYQEEDSDSQVSDQAYLARVLHRKKDELSVINIEADNKSVTAGSQLSRSTLFDDELNPTAGEIDELLSDFKV
jgi:hypothetical protein